MALNVYSALNTFCEWNFHFFFSNFFLFYVFFFYFVQFFWPYSTYFHSFSSLFTVHPPFVIIHSRFHSILFLEQVPQLFHFATLPACQLSTFYIPCHLASAITSFRYAFFTVQICNRLPLRIATGYSHQDWSRRYEGRKSKTKEKIGEKTAMGPSCNHLIFTYKIFLCIQIRFIFISSPSLSSLR